MALAAAERILSEEGLKGFSARKLATAIDYTVGTLYQVFENLDDIVLQINGRTLDDLHEWLSIRLPPTDTPLAKLCALANAYIDYAESHGPRWNLLFDFVAGKEDSLPDWYIDKLSRVFGLAESALAPLDGARSPLEIQQAARVLWAGVHGICTLKIRQRMDLAGGQSAKTMALSLIENFLGGFERQSPDIDI